MEARILIEDVDGNREAWLDARRDKLGASEIPIVLGLSPFCTPLQLALRKQGKLPDQEDNDHLFFGRAVEPIVAELFTRKTKIPCRKANRLYQHKALDFAIASPDYFYDGKDGSLELLEIKVTSWTQREKWADGGCPDTAHIQLIWQLGVLGLERGTVAGLVGGSPRYLFLPQFSFDPSIWAQLVERAQAFMECVRNGKEPPAMAPDTALIAQLKQFEPSKFVTLDESADEVVTKYWEEKREIERLEKLIEPHKKTLDNSKARLLQLMGDCGKAKAGRFELQAATVQRNEYVVKASSYTTLKVKEVQNG
jgi:putative phage-type endonuclease